MNTIPPTQAAANGVKHWAAGSRPEIQARGDVYELPAGVAGVPEHITVIPARWGMFGGEASAADAQGHALQVTAWPEAIRVVDAASGTVTTVDRESLQVTISAPVLSTTRPMLSGARTVSQCALQETLEPDGTVKIRTGYRSTEERVVYAAVREMPPTESMTVALDEDYQLTTLSPEKGPQTRVISRSRHEDPVVKGSLESRVDESGDLTLDFDDGHEERWHLFVAPHAVAGVVV